MVRVIRASVATLVFALCCSANEDPYAYGDANPYVEYAGYLPIGFVVGAETSLLAATQRCDADIDCVGITHNLGSRRFELKGRGIGPAVLSKDWASYIKREVGGLAPSAGDEEGDLERFINPRIYDNPAFAGKPPRFVKDGLYTDEECEDFKAFALSLKPQAREYLGTGGKTIVAGFYGMGLNRMLTTGSFNGTIVATLLRAREAVRQSLVDHFGLTRPLYHSFTHIVIREADEESAMAKETGYSHKVHADHCMYNKTDGSCKRTKSSCCAHRHYSAIMYFNECDGGEIEFYTNDQGQLVPLLTVEPKCGRWAGFSAGPENPHGVKLIRTGRRIVVAMWFTLDREYAERVPMRDPPYTEAQRQQIRAKSSCKAVSDADTCDFSTPFDDASDRVAHVLAMFGNNKPVVDGAAPTK